MDATLVRYARKILLPQHVCFDLRTNAEQLRLDGFFIQSNYVPFEDIESLSSVVKSFFNMCRFLLNFGV